MAPDFPFLPQRGCLARGFASLDMVDLEHVFEFRALVMKSVPKFMRGRQRSVEGQFGGDEEGTIGGK